ncbi:hypothetical protein ACOME3_000320 [Neoechinorhynchus agilis]
MIKLIIAAIFTETALAREAERQPQNPSRNVYATVGIVADCLMLLVIVLGILWCLAKPIKRKFFPQRLKSSSTDGSKSDLGTGRRRSSVRRNTLYNTIEKNEGSSTKIN